MIVRLLVFFTLVLCVPSFTLAADYHCAVEKKLDDETTYTKSRIEEGQFSVKVEERGENAFLPRCSFVLSANEVTCDRYQADKIVFDQNAKIKKYYHFSSQMDVQIFSNLSFVENHGRGGIAYGTCRITSP